MGSTRIRCALKWILVLSVTAAPPGALAQAPKTAVLLMVTGVRPAEFWKENDAVQLGAEGKWHVAAGRIELRALDPSVHEVMLASNGDVEFCEGQALPEGAAAIAAIPKLHGAGQFHRFVNLTFPPGARTQEAGYVVRTPEPGPAHASAQIIVAVPGSEPEALPISLEVFDEPPWWREYLSVITTLAGTLVGAVVGLGVFLFQQWRTQK